MFDLPDLRPILILAAIGLLATCGVAFWILIWLIQHVRFV